MGLSIQNLDLQRYSYRYCIMQRATTHTSWCSWIDATVVVLWCGRGILPTVLLDRCYSGCNVMWMWYSSNKAYRLTSHMVYVECIFWNSSNYFYFVEEVVFHKTMEMWSPFPLIPTLDNNVYKQRYIA